tara:strand:- start:1100 stop:1255 length:156 start_codon:yes stop_codon:yes gene_type:complete
MKLRVTMRQFVDKNGNTWEWEETEETRKALKQLHKTSAEAKLHAPPTKPKK